MILWILVTLNSLGVLFLLWVVFKTLIDITFERENSKQVRYKITFWKKTGWGANRVASISFPRKKKKK